MKSCRIVLGLSLVLTASLMVAQEEEDSTLRLKLGDPARKNKTMYIYKGEIYSTKTGEAVTFERMMRDMQKSRYIYVGESHNSLPMHDIQFRVADALVKQDPQLVIGLEMFDTTWQEQLNRWSLGLLTEEEFIDQAEWYVNWNLNFNYYKKIFILAKENKIPVYALNAPREVIRKVRMEGWEALTSEEKELVPEPDLTHAEHLELMRNVFGGGEMPGSGHGDMMFKSLYRAQAAWDGVMARNARRAARIENSRVIVLAGSGHLWYDLGINLRVRQKDPQPSSTLICVTVPEGEKAVEVSRSLADYIWGLPEEERPVYPSDGLALKKFDGIDNPVLERNPITGVARGKDFKKGDIVLSVDGKSYTSINNLRKYLARFSWGDEVTFTLLREAKVITVTLKYEMTPMKMEEKSEEASSRGGESSF